MVFLRPEMLWLLLIVPVLVAAYLLLLRRKRKLALAYASLTIIKEALDAARQKRRHLPPLLFLLAFILMLIAIARPASMIMLPSQYSTVILAIDISDSMQASDIAPSRIAAAQAAARNFVAEQPGNTRVGVVSFAGTASVVQPPTLNRKEILSALDRLQIDGGTAVGSGILVSLKLIFQDIEFDLMSLKPRPRDSRDTQHDIPSDEASTTKIPDFKPVQPGSDTSAAIILLSDGETNRGPDPIEASRMAAERGIRVFTVGIGTHDSEVLIQKDLSINVGLDEKALKEIASVTHAEYFYGSSAIELTKIYKKLNSKLVLEKKVNEITALFTATAAIMAMMSGFLSLLWFNRIL
ncbi:MAG: von Willebrand factor, type [Herminiimonas sp.]|nr:von Willebrand factor, type [Herminiimonas sp.]